MKILATAPQMEANPILAFKLIEKLLKYESLDNGQLNHGELQYCLTNNIRVEAIRAYSPVILESVIDSFVPEGWPGATYEDAEGETQRVTYRNFTQCFEVTGGWCARFCAGRKTINGGISNPSWNEFKVWENQANGFLTEAEFQAIKITTD